MADKIDVEITNRETIKPCSPTPQQLRTVNFSYLDQIALDMYIPIILFYPFTTITSHSENPTERASERVQRLRETLSKTLGTHFYPLAGRVRNNQFIECNDEGAGFVEAKAPFPMSEILKRPDLDSLKKLLAAGTDSRLDAVGGCLLLVQTTVFECGGISVGVQFSHKIMDACSISGFLKTWAKTSQDDNEALVLKPEFGTACDIFPPILESSFNPSSLVATVDEKYAVRRFVFTGEKIAALKSKVSSIGRVPNPTRVEAVSGLLWKCLIKALASKPTDDLQSSRTTSNWYHVMNLRKRIVPPLGFNVVGNLTWAFMAETDEKEDIDVLVLVGKLRIGLDKHVENYVNKDHNIAGIIQRQLETILNTKNHNEIDACKCTSWCRFGYYDADFGWGKPVWVSVVCFDFDNIIVMMDTSDGDGIEAWVSFNEQRMASIERDQELLAYASLNPSVI